MAKKPVMSKKSPYDSLKKELPEAKLESMKAIPHIDLQNKFKEIAKLKTDLMRERMALIANTNKKIADIDKQISEYEGSMKTLIEFINMKRKR